MIFPSPEKNQKWGETRDWETDCTSWNVKLWNKLSTAWIPSISSALIQYLSKLSSYSHFLRKVQISFDFDFKYINNLTLRLTLTFPLNWILSISCIFTRTLTYKFALAFILILTLFQPLLYPCHWYWPWKLMLTFSLTLILITT